MNDDKIHFDIETLVDGDPSITVYKPRCVGCSEHNVIVIGIDKASVGTDKTVSMLLNLNRKTQQVLIVDDRYDMDKLTTELKELLVLTNPKYEPPPLPEKNTSWKRNKKTYFGKNL